MSHLKRAARAIGAEINILVLLVIRMLERLSAKRDYPAFIRSDKGPALIAAARVEWVGHKEVILDFIQPDYPIQNELIEHFKKIRPPE